MDETYGRYVDDECFDIPDCGDDTDDDTDDDDPMILITILMMALMMILMMVAAGTWIQLRLMDQ